MTETPTAPAFDPALWAEAVAWQQECGVFALVDPAPVDAFALKSQAQRATEVASAPASRASSNPEQAPARPPARPKSTPSNRHARRGLEAVDAIAEAEKRASACSNVEELRAAVEAFDGCLLKETASKTVFADGDPNSGVMVIGSAPGAEEDREGLPFVGPRGVLLDTMLKFIGLERSSGFLATKIVFWRPPGNREPNASEVAVCWPFTKRHIELVKPKVILAVGGLAAQTLVDPKLRITKDRGKWKSIDVSGTDVPVLPTLSLKHLLTMPINKREAWTDILKLKEFLKDKTP